MSPYMSPFKRNFYEEVWKKYEQIIDHQVHKYKAKDGTLVTTTLQCVLYDKQYSSYHKPGKYNIRY